MDLRVYHKNSGYKLLPQQYPLRFVDSWVDYISGTPYFIQKRV